MRFSGLRTSQAMSSAKGKGQDRLLITPTFIGVADGATPLDPSWPANVGEFAAEALRELAAAGAEEGAEIREVWRKAITKTAAKFSAKEPELSCGVAIARRVKDTVEIATLGDCGVIVLHTDKSLVTLRDTRLSVLDEEAAAASGTEERRRLVYNRAAMNTPAGYWIFAAHPAAADHILRRQIPLGNIAGLLLFTDGFYRLRDPYGLVGDDRALMTLVRELGPEGAMRQLREYEESDSSHVGIVGLRAPDDATLVMATQLA